MEILINFIITIIIIISAVFILSYLEKRITALFTLQNRPKENRSGIFQNAANALKMLIKEDTAPVKRKKILYFAAPLIMFCAAISAFSLISLNNFCIISDSFPSVILFMALVLIPVIAIFLAGYSSGRQPLISAIQAISRALGYIIPMITGVLAAAFMAGTLNINGIIQEQNSSAGLFGWYFIPQIIGCAVFFICTLALLNCLAFNLSKSENAMISSCVYKYSGLKYEFFMLSKRVLLLSISAFFVCIYFGGYLSPFGTYILPDFLIPMEQWFWLILKTFLIIFFIILIRTAIPKLSYERFLELSYKILLPLSLINLNIVILIRYFAGVQ